MLRTRAAAVQLQNVADPVVDGLAELRTQGPSAADSPSIPCMWLVDEVHVMLIAVTFEP